MGRHFYLAAGSSLRYLSVPLLNSNIWNQTLSNREVFLSCSFYRTIHQNCPYSFFASISSQCASVESTSVYSISSFAQKYAKSFTDSQLPLLMLGAVHAFRSSISLALDTILVYSSYKVQYKYSKELISK